MWGFMLDPPWKADKLLTHFESVALLPSIGKLRSDDIQTGGKASRDPAWMKRYRRSTLAGSVILARVLP